MAYGTYKARVAGLPQAYSGLRQTSPNNPYGQGQGQQVNDLVARCNLTQDELDALRAPCKCEKASCFWWAVGGAAVGILVGVAVM